MRMRIGLVVASYGRPEQVQQLLSSIERQARLPDEIVLSVVSDADVSMTFCERLRVNVIYSEPGLCAQRNKGMASLLDRTDIVVFVDDDFWMSSTYIYQLERLFSENRDIVAVTGLVLADGATTSGISATPT